MAENCEQEEIYALYLAYSDPRVPWYAKEKMKKPVKKSRTPSCLKKYLDVLVGVCNL
jgi:hypothetical protein